MPPGLSLHMTKSCDATAVFVKHDCKDKNHQYTNVISHVSSLQNINEEERATCLRIPSLLVPGHGAGAVSSPAHAHKDKPQLTFTSVSYYWYYNLIFQGFRVSHFLSYFLFTATKNIEFWCSGYPGICLELVFLKKCAIVIARGHPIWLSVRAHLAGSLQFLFKQLPFIWHMSCHHAFLYSC